VDGREHSGLEEHEKLGAPAFLPAGEPKAPRDEEPASERSRSSSLLSKLDWRELDLQQLLRLEQPAQ
jgi:hypothetical protein